MSFEILEQLDNCVQFQMNSHLQLGVHFYKSGVLRLHYSNGVPTQKAQDEILSYPAAETYRLVENESTWVLSWADGSFLLEKQTGAFSVVRGGQSLVSSRALEPIVYFPKERKWRLSEALSHGEAFFGLGDKTGSLNKRQKRFELNMRDAMGFDARFSDPLYKLWPFLLSINSKSGLIYGEFISNPSVGRVDLGAEIHNYYGPFRSLEVLGDQLEVFYFLGDSPQDILSSYLTLIGGTSFLPQWAFGYLGSTMTYTEAEQVSSELEGFLENLKKYKIPCEAFHLSSGYCKHGDSRWSFVWNEERCQGFEACAQKFATAGIHLNANLKPFIPTDHPLLPELKKQKLLVQSQSGESAKIPYWDSHAYLLDFSLSETRQWWAMQSEKQLFSKGINSLWNDNNEFPLDGREAVLRGVEGQAEPEVRALQIYQMAKASYEVTASKTKRPYLLSRSMSPGVQRFAQTWSGDNSTSWTDFRHQHFLGMNLSLSGIYHFGHDLGGFAGPFPDEELFLRWLQYGVFLPRFCIHSWNPEKRATEPWSYPTSLSAIQGLFGLRYQLIPYLNHLNFRAAQYHEPIVRPPIFEIAEADPESDLFYLGDAILVAPIFDQGVNEKQIQFPEDSDFYDRQGRRFKAGSSRSFVCTVQDAPLFFFREASLVPWAQYQTKPEQLSQMQIHWKYFPAQDKHNSVREIYIEPHAEVSLAEAARSLVSLKVDEGPRELSIQLEAKNQLKPLLEKATCELPHGKKKKLRWTKSFY